MWQMSWHRKVSLALIFLLAFCRHSFADPAVADSGTRTNSAVGSSIQLTTLTVNSGATMLVAWLMISGAPGSVPAAQWDSAGTPQNMTATTNVTNTIRIYMFELANPTSGNKTLTVSWTTSRNARVFAIAYSGSATTLTNVTTNSGTSTSASSGAITVTSTGVTLAGVSASDTINSVDTQTSLGIVASSPGSSASRSVVTGAGSNTHDWTIASSTTWAVAGASLAAATLATGAINCTLLGVC